MRQQALHFNAVEKNFGHIHALKSFDLKIALGEKVAILGSNGAGKSTFLNLTAGLQIQNSGHIQVLGQDPRSKEVKKRRAFLPQELNFPATLKVREILTLTAKHFSHHKLTEIEDLLGLTSYAQRKARELSGGERKRVALACTLIANPTLLILDEPTANIDFQGKKFIHQVLEKIFQDQDRTMLFSSHEMKEVEELADRIVVIHKGQIRADGPTHEIKNRFGAKKVSFLNPSTSEQPLSFQSCLRHYKEGNTHHLFGPKSDDMLREVLAKIPQAKNIQLEGPSLEEVMVKIWNDGEDL